MKHFFPPAALVLTLAASACASAVPATSSATSPAASAAASAWAPRQEANIVWTSFGRGAMDSMPLSGHNLGVNAWVENGDLLLLLASPNCLDARGMQVKLGLLRLRFDRPIFAKGFRQELRLAQSEIVVSGVDEAGKTTTVTLFGDAGSTVLRAKVAGDAPVGVTVAYETWTKPNPKQSVAAYEGKVEGGALLWSRRLPSPNPRRLADMKAQGMEAFAADIPDPLSGLTCGGRIDGVNLVAAQAPADMKLNGLPLRGWAVKTAAPTQALDLTVTLRMEQDASQEAFDKALAADAQKAKADAPRARAKALAWWADFWNRSHIAISPTADTASNKDKPWQAGRNYQIIRYMLGANASGRAMTLFNGGHFTCSGNPDGRNWDGCQFMAQNQRLVYWPFLKSGDFDLLKVGLDFYLDRTAMSRRHAKKFWDVDGVAWSEAFGIFGLDAIGTNAEGRCKPRHLPFHHTSGLEFALMMLRYPDFSGKDLPGGTDTAIGCLSYYDQYYQKRLEKTSGKPLDESGRLVIYPSDACEPYHGCTNNLDVIAGLRAICRALLAMPEGKLTAQQRAYVEGFFKRIPEYTMDEKDGRKFFKAAKSWEWVFYNGNMDFPQMYILFPFDEIMLGRGDMQLAKNTWTLSAIKESVQHQNQCWYQTAINTARMGDTVEAAEHTLEKLLHRTGGRFPTFYRTSYAGGGGDFCHMPDTDHGGTAMIALQEMLMQTDGKRILLGPAWPMEWNGHFKLHAPLATTVEGKIEGGKVVVTKVTPADRAKDIEIFPLKSAAAPHAPAAGHP